MTVVQANPAAAKGPRAAYLADIFMRARRCSKSFSEIRDGLEAEANPNALADALMDADALLAAITAPALTRVDALLAVLPHHTEIISVLDSTEAVDALMRPIFREAGLEHDFDPSD